MKHSLPALMATALVAPWSLHAQKIDSSQVFSVTASRVTRIQAVAPDELLLWVESMREIDNPGHAFTRQYDIIEWHGGIEFSRRPVSRREAQRRDGEGQIPAESNRFKVAVSPTTGLGTVVMSNCADRVDFSGDAEIRTYIANASTDIPADASPIVVTDVAADQEKIYVLYPVFYPSDRTTLVGRFQCANTGRTFKAFRLRLPSSLIYPMLIAASGDTVFIAGEANRIADDGGVQ
ncbi:MAG: hypothetical protein KIT09_12835 [Bryobacteraceae bacterium]|nr:hypothetical protein [Bryobacteraceae bacterium]